MPVQVQYDDFEVGEVLSNYTRQLHHIGAVVNFVGYVRAESASANQSVQKSSQPQAGDLSLEHYPGMTEKALLAIIHQAMQRWPEIVEPLVIHRVGRLPVGAQIVLVMVGSRHRQIAFQAAEFIMDYLKTDAPFWKYQHLEDGSGYWVEARSSDVAARERW